MKIALLSEKYTPDIGGLAISTARLARLLTSAGHTVHVLAPTSSLPPSETRTVSHDGIAVTRFGIRKRVDDTLVDWFELLASSHKQDPFSLLHAYFLTQAGFVAAYAGNYLDLPSVVSARGNDLERAVFDPARAAHILFALQQASAVTTNARELEKKARTLVPDLDMTVIPNGIDVDHFRPLPRNEELARQIGLSTNDTKKHEGVAVVGFVGEMREKKGMATILYGYTQLARKHPCALLIVGEVRAGEDKRSFDEFLAANPDARIVVTGYVSPAQLPAYYSLMDVVVHPSLRDGLPNALLEAMACEKPVIATPVGGIPDAVIDRENGLLIPVDDGSAMAEAVESLWTDRELAHRYSRAARGTILKRFTLAAELELNLNVYRKLGVKV
jgi:glycosyltransferase involved in cell wall biosynthesis